jgi:class 3 adenylate cyclase
MNREHHALLVEAELARVLGEPQRAAERYDLAIARAHAHGFLNDEALACELAGEFYFAQGRSRMASSYLKDARHLWQRWGAKALVDALDARHPAETMRGSASAGTLGTTTVELDLGTVLKASDALAGEIELAALIGRVMRVTLENAGASRGVLVLYRSGVPHVEVEQHAVTGEPPRMWRVPLPTEGAKDAPLPVSLVRYALRTGDPVLIDDASQEGAQFASDPYVMAHRPRAALGLPLMKQGRAVGALYLENKLTTGVFGPERLGLLRVLASQAAISLENALLYEGLQQSLHTQVELTRANERFVPREFLAALGHVSIAGVALGDSVQKEMTVLFSDMRAFTSHVEGQRPGENIAFINDYLSDMEPAIVEAGGFVDSYIGDAILALFDVEPERAVRAGLGMLRRLRGYNARRTARGLAPVFIGVGVNSGLLTLGTMGGAQRLRCGVIGDPVNLSARIESLTKHYGVPFLVSDDTMRLLPSDHGFSYREVDRVRVAGRKRPVTLFEVYEPDEPARIDPRTQVAGEWERALRACESRSFSHALQLFRQVEQQLPEDPVVRLRIARCAKYLAAPPGEDWEGVEALSSK